MNQVENPWKPELTSDRKLIGPYPEVIDLCDGRFPELDFSEESLLVIANDPNVRRILLPSDVVGVNHLVIEDLPGLEELNLVGEPDGFSKSVQWVSISNVPLLKKVSLIGDVCSLEIEGAASLTDLNVGGCPSLDHVRIIDPSVSLKVDVTDCLKLRSIFGIHGDLEYSSGLTEQVQSNQSRSRHDGNLYDSMTFTDIDLVGDLINEGVKALSRAGLLQGDEGSMLGRYDLVACNPQFKPYSYRILRPLEPVYTGGTGETYAYVFIQRYVDANDLKISDDEGAGNDSPESCLSYMLHWIRMGLSNLPQVEGTSDDQLLDYLKAASERIAGDTISGLPIRISSSLSSSESQSLIEFANQIGMATCDGDVENYAYVHPESGSPPDEKGIDRAATLSIDLPTALMQMTRLRDWKATRTAL